MPRYWFTSDTHFGHKNVIRHCNRPFLTIEEHDKILIYNWNCKVNKNDVVWHMGDFCISGPNYVEKILEQLNGKINIILGNHDKVLSKSHIKERFVSVNQHKMETFQIKAKTYKIFMSHYACRTWPLSHYGSYHLYGHSHGHLPPHGKSFDVGVDCHNFTPISLEQVIEKMEKL